MIILTGGVTVNGMYTTQGSIEARDPIILDMDHQTAAVAFQQWLLQTISSWRANEMTHSSCEKATLSALGRQPACEPVCGSSTVIA